MGDGCSFIARVNYFIVRPAGRAERRTDGRLPFVHSISSTRRRPSITSLTKPPLHACWDGGVLGRPFVVGLNYLARHDIAATAHAWNRSRTARSARRRHARPTVEISRALPIFSADEAHAVGVEVSR